MNKWTNFQAVFHHKSVNKRTNVEEVFHHKCVNKGTKSSNNASP